MLKGAARNQPCPCGSGVKAKRCTACALPPEREPIETPKRAGVRGSTKTHLTLAMLGALGAFNFPRSGR